MSKYRAYPKYKQSNLTWSDSLPTGWSTIPLKRISKLVNGSTPKSGVEEYWDGEIKWITPADMGKLSSPYISHGARSITRAGLESCGTHLVPESAIVVSTRAPIGAVSIASSELCTNQGCKSLICQRKVEPKFIYYQLLINKAELNKLGRGTTFVELSSEDLASFNVSLPSLDEQTQIATFLDRETAKIDRLIEKQQRLIKLLEEKRQAVISHAVTKGVNPGASMKDSEVEWLGEVPEHWEVTKFSYIKTLLTDYTANGSFADLKKNVTYLTEEDGFARLIRLTDLRKDLRNSDGVWIDKSAYKYLAKSALYGGEFLLANVGAYAGLFYQMPSTDSPASLAPNMFMAKFDSKKVLRDYMAIIGQSDNVYKQLRLRATASSAQPKLNKDDFKSVYCALPPIHEQKEILSFLNKELETIEKLFTNSHRSISLLKERRTALISAAVTGKIDVREQVPQDVEEVVAS